MTIGSDESVEVVVPSPAGLVEVASVDAADVLVIHGPSFKQVLNRAVEVFRMANLCGNLSSAFLTPPKPPSSAFRPTSTLAPMSALGLPQIPPAVFLFRLLEYSDNDRCV